jgi:transcriptional regulator with XRE-family HTH domain
MQWKLDLGRQLKEARKSAGLTQRALATRLSISRQMICRYEAGRDAPAIEVLALAAAELDVEFQVLGMRISSPDMPYRAALRSLPKQLNLQFNKSRSFRHAIVKITPHKGRILITADIPA